MATKESERVDAYRRMKFDRISFLISKGGKQLLRILALKEGVNVTELIRRAVLARAGLNMLPSPTVLKAIDGENVKTPLDAKVIVRTLQNQERIPARRNIIQDQGIEIPTAEYSIFIDSQDEYDLMKIQNKIMNALRTTPKGLVENWQGTPVYITGAELSVLRRMLANCGYTDDTGDG